jgi:hypothetical protein
MRGHGRSPGARRLPSFGTSVRDVQTFMRAIGEHHGFAPGRSPSSRRASARSSRRARYAPPIRGMASRVQGEALRPLAWGCSHARACGNFFVTSHVKGASHARRGRAASYDTDALIARSISVNILLGCSRLDRIVADAQAITVPTQL